MLTKALGSLLVLAGGAMARWTRLRERRKKLDTLSELMGALRRMGEEIRMARTPLPVLLERLAAECAGDAGTLFRSGAEALRAGEDPAEAWRLAAEDLPLAAEDRRTAAELGRDLRGDEESVCKAISLSLYALAKSAEEQSARRGAEDRRDTALCFSAAALAVILLI